MTTRRSRRTGDRNHESRGHRNRRPAGAAGQAERGSVPPEPARWYAEALEPRLLLAADAAASSLRAGLGVEYAGPAGWYAQAQRDVGWQAARQAPTAALAPLPGQRAPADVGVGPAVGFSDLAPVTPTGWSGPIVVSTVTGTNTNAVTIRPTDTIFVDVALANIGFESSAATNAVVVLDGVVRQTLGVPAVSVGTILTSQDLNLGTLSAGTHTIDFVADPGNTLPEFDESNNGVRYTFQVVNTTGSADLAPFQPNGWSGNIVLSTVTGTHTDATSIAPTDHVYLDAAWNNIGNTGTGAYQFQVIVDGGTPQTGNAQPLEPFSLQGTFAAVQDVDLGTLAAGPHTVQIKLDSGSVIAEGNEANNTFSRQFTVGSSGQADLAPFQPNGWSGNIVVSTVAGTNTDSVPIAPTDPLFIDFALNNIGSSAAGPFQVQLLLDNNPLDTFGSPGLEPFSLQGAFQNLIDFQIGAQPAGVHTVTVKLDSGNAVSESNEANNTFTKQITVGTPQPGSISGTVYEDQDGDGARDAGEPPLAGWQVYLDANNNVALDPGETNVLSSAQGAYTFGNLAAGTYIVREVVQGGFTQTFPGPGGATITVAPGQNVSLDGGALARLASPSAAASPPGLDAWVDDAFAAAGGRIRRHLTSPLSISLDGLRVTHAVSASATFDIVLKKGPNLLANPAASAAFDQAAAFYESIFSDPVMVVIDAEIAPLGPNILGQTGSTSFTLPNYDDLRNLIAQDATADEQIATRIPTAAQFQALLPDGSFSAAGASANRATLKALGIPENQLGGNASKYDPSVKADMDMTFSSNFPFDFDRSNGIDADKFDFIGVAIHEIGHGLGFVSNVDQVDFLLDNPQFPRQVAPSALDLFRLRPGAGTNNGFATAPRVLTPAGDQVVFDDRYNPQGFVTIPGLTLGDVPMSQGVAHGDQHQASHWKDNQITGVQIGIMDPTAANTGVILQFTDTDKRAFGLIGYDLIGSTPPAANAYTIQLAAGQNATGKDFANRRNNQLPTIGGLTDTPDPVALGANLTLTATNVADADGTVANVKFYRETNATAGLQTGAGGDTQVGTTDTNGADGWSTTFATTGLTASQTYTYYAQATDNGGAVSAAASTTNTVQSAVNQPPVINSVTANPNPAPPNGSTTITANGVSDPDGTVASVKFYQESNGTAGLQPATDILFATDTNGADGWSTPLDLAGVPAGTYTIYALATDNLAATSATGAAAAKVDLVVGVTNNPPTVGSLTADPSTVTVGQPIMLTANNVADPDAGDAVAGVSFYRESNVTPGLQTGLGGDTLISTDNSAFAGWTAVFQTTGLPPGQYTLYAQATDTHAATSTPAQATVTLQAANLPPVVASLTATPTTASPGQNIALTANGVADADGTVASVSFYRESNATAGLQTGAGGDTLIGTDGNAFAGWTGLLLTASLAAGDYTLYAQATDNLGAVSTPVSTPVAITGGTSATPGVPDLLAASDTGVSNTDNLANLDNSTAARVLQFSVAGTVAGALVEVLADGQVIGSATAAGATTTVTTNGAFDLTDGNHQVTSRQTEPGKQASATFGSLQVTVDTAAPRVSGVVLAGSGWASSFLDWLGSHGLGFAGATTGGFLVPGGGAAQLQTIPWPSVNRLRLRFTEPLAPGSLGAASLAVTGVLVPTYELPAGGFVLDATGLVATWALNAGVTFGLDKVRLTVPAAALVDPAGNALDGEWADGAQAYPSGNGAAGGDFRFRFNVVPGDANRNNTTDVIDAGQAKQRVPSDAVTRTDNYSPFYDFNANGLIDVIDAGQIKQRVPQRLSDVAGEPASAPLSLAAPPFGAVRIAAAAATAAEGVVAPEDELAELLA